MLAAAQLLPRCGGAQLWGAARGSSRRLTGDGGNGFFSDGPKGMEHRGCLLTEVKAGGGMDYGQSALPCLDGFGGGVCGAALVLGMLCRAPRGAAPPCPVPHGPGALAPPAS